MATQRKIPANTLRPSVLLLAIFFSGCDNVTVEEVNISQNLDFALFSTQINPIFDQNINGKTCTAVGCHNVNGGSGGALRLNPGLIPSTTVDCSAQMIANFISTSTFVNKNDPEGSKLIQEPLDGSSALTGTHSGGDLFSISTAPADPYTKIINWIRSPVAVGADLSTLCPGS